MNVIKRDEREVIFDKNKIVTAILKAYREVDKDKHDEEAARERAENIAEFVEHKNKTMTVEEIQDIIESKLMASNRKDVAKAYILYRNERNKARERKSKLIKSVLNRVNSTVDERSNANVDEKSFSGREKESMSEIGKTMALEYGGLSDDVAAAHKEMLVYQHDLEKAVYGIHN